MGFSKSSAKGEVHINTSRHQEIGEKSNNLTLHLKQVAGRNINNLRYADDTTLMAESEEELKST